MSDNTSISCDHANLIRQLRDAVKDELTPYYDNDFNLLRWLQGYEYSLDAVIPKLKNHLAFRKSSWDLDKIADQPRNHPIHTYWKTGITGPAIKTPNTIVNIEQTGSNDYWGMMSTFSVLEILKARVYDLETMLKRVTEMENATGKQASILYIMDLNGLKYDKRLLYILSGSLGAISSFMAEHYVEMIYRFVVVNVPSFLATLWGIIKPALPERTRNKIQILGSNWKEEILQLAVPDVLPSYWNEGAHNIFKANIERALNVNIEKYYKQEIRKEAKILNVSAGKIANTIIKVEKGSILQWWIITDGNFGFSLFHLNDANSDTEKSVYPTFKKIPGPMLVPIEDKILCEEDGYYKFEFNNEHAWIHTLKVNYIIIAKP